MGHAGARLEPATQAPSGAHRKAETCEGSSARPKIFIRAGEMSHALDASPFPLALAPQMTARTRGINYKMPTGQPDEPF